MARNRIKDLIRTSNSSKSAEEKYRENNGRSESGLDSRFADIENAELAASLVGGLRNTERQVIELTYFGGLRMEEAAARLGISQREGYAIKMSALEQMAGAAKRRHYL